MRATAAVGIVTTVAALVALITRHYEFAAALGFFGGGVGFGEYLTRKERVD